MTENIPKHKPLLKAFQKHKIHNSDGANQSAATFREIKKRGYLFEEVSPNRLGQKYVL